MRQRSSFVKAHYSVWSYIAVQILLLASLFGLGWAFYSSGLSSNFFFALLAGTEGFLFGGVVLTLTGTIRPNMKLAIRAVGGSALFLAALLHPLLASTAHIGSLPGPRPPERGIFITSPLTGSVVGPTAQINGHTDYPWLRHFIIVTGLKAGGDIVQDSEVNVSSTGEISVNATLGGAAVGAGEMYTIRIVACETALNAGPLVSRKDLIVSNVISVVRSIQHQRS
jgi:hypothetical protein